MEQRRREPLRAPKSAPAGDSQPTSPPYTPPAGDAPRAEAPPAGNEAPPQPPPYQPAWGAPSSPPPPAVPPAPPAFQGGLAAMGSGTPTPVSNGRRFGAWLLDGVLAVVTLFIGWIIWSLVIWGKGQSPGKALLGMRVVMNDSGRAASWGTMAVREFLVKGLLGGVTGGILSLASAIMILATDERQGVWDKMVSTTVVDDPDGRLLSGNEPPARSR